MKLSNSFIAVKKIKSSVPRSTFSEDDLSLTAKLILGVEGLINPIILRRTSSQSYEVVDGHFEYHAAVTAKEIDAQKGEYISAFIIDPDNEKVFEEQIQLLRRSHSLHNTLSKSSDREESMSTDIKLLPSSTESRMTNIESRFDNRITELQDEFRRAIKEMLNRLQEVENRVPKPIEPLEALNNLTLSDLTSKLKRVSVSQKVINSIVNERKNGQFKSFSNVVERVKGLGDKTMLKIIDSFNEGTA